MRGGTRTLHQLSIVDATVGYPEATATAYFGLKTPTHSLLDVWLPSDYAQQTEPTRTECFLKPMPSPAEMFSPSAGYADPARYQLVPASAELRKVPIRATLKQFEGRWAGQLRRSLEADIRVASRPRPRGVAAPEIQRGSTITNNLGHDLTNCYLIQSWDNAFTAAGLQRRLPGRDILVHRLGAIADGEQIDVAQRAYFDPETGGQRAVEDWISQTLGEFQIEWAYGFSDLLGMLGRRSDVVEDAGLEPHQNALLVLSTLSEHDPRNLGGEQIRVAGVDFPRRHCRQLDRSDNLTTDQIMLVGFAKDQGPVTLCTRTGDRAYKPLFAERAYTMYRFSIPVVQE
jgi:hypothetical protein